MEKVSEYVKNMLLLIVSVCFTFFCIEMYLVINDRSSANIRLSNITLNNTKYRFLEDKEAFLDIKKSIVFVGDSMTVGAKCGKENNFPGQFKKILNDNSIELNTINLGIIATGTFSYLDSIKDFLTTFETPTAIIVTLYMNDIELEPSLCQYVDLMAKNNTLTEVDYIKISNYCKQIEEKQEYSKIQTIHRWFVTHFHSYRFLQEGLIKMLIAHGYSIGWGRSSYPQKWGKHNGLNFKLIRFSLEEIKKITDTYEVPLIIFFYPDVGFLSHKSPYVTIYQSVTEKLTAELSVPVYSGYEAFLSQNDQQKSPVSMTWSITDDHPNCEAHQIFAGWIFTKLISNDNILQQKLE
jgi:hypothetical protein